MNWWNKLIFCVLLGIQESLKLIQWFMDRRGQKRPWPFNSWVPKICCLLLMNLWFELTFWMLKRYHCFFVRDHYSYTSCSIWSICLLNISYIVHIQSFYGPNARKYGPEKLWIRTFFTQCMLLEYLLYFFYSVRIRENTDQINSKFGHFLRSDPLTP